MNKVKALFVLAAMGILAGLLSVVVYSERIKKQQPVAVSYNPYDVGVYATGIIESYQPAGSNVNIYPEVTGRVTHVFVKDGQIVTKDTPLFAIDDSVQRALVAKDMAQIHYAQASLVNVQQQLQKIHRSYVINSKSISKNTLDNAMNAVHMAKESLQVAIGQYQSDKALLEEYHVKAPIDGTILRVVTTKGGYVSPSGSYDPYTQNMLPSVQMGVVTPYLQVRCYVDEILVPKLPTSQNLVATMLIRGLNNRKVPLQFINIQPFTIPNIQLSDERNERVDVRVLPILFKFTKPSDINIFPGQLVDVFIKGKQ